MYIISKLIRRSQCTRPHSTGHVLGGDANGSPGKIEVDTSTAARYGSGGRDDRRAFDVKGHQYIER